MTEMSHGFLDDEADTLKVLLERVNNNLSY